MATESITDIHKKLEKLMYGYNYQVTLGYNLFENCSSIQSFKARLKDTYENSRPDFVTLLQIHMEDFWQEINAALDYRGDITAGLILNQKKTLELEVVQKKYKDHLSSFICDQTVIYSYPDDQGIPGYPVYWEFRFLLLTASKNCVFIYGSASD